MAHRLLMEGICENHEACHGFVTFKPTKVESVEIELPTTLQEAEGERGRVKRTKVSGIFQRVGEVNHNGRRYGEELWERILDPKGSFMQRLAGKEVMAELEHPESGNTDLNRVSHIITELWRGGQDIKGSYIILRTPSGQKLEEIHAVAGSVGISSRGRGDTTPSTEEGVEDVNPDFLLDTFDAVAKPSVGAARPKVVGWGELRASQTHQEGSLATYVRPQPPITVSVAESVVNERSETMAQVAMERFSHAESAIERIGKTLREAKDVGSLMRAQVEVTNLLTRLSVEKAPEEMREDLAELRGRLQGLSERIMEQMTKVGKGPLAEATESPKPDFGNARKLIESLTAKVRELKGALAEAEKLTHYTATNEAGKELHTTYKHAFEETCRFGQAILDRLVAEHQKAQEAEHWKQKCEGAVKLLEAVVAEAKGVELKRGLKEALATPSLQKFETILKECKTPTELKRRIEQVTPIAEGLGRRTDLPPVGKAAVTEILSEAASEKPQFSGSIFGRLAEREARQKAKSMQESAGATGPRR